MEENPSLLEVKKTLHALMQNTKNDFEKAHLMRLNLSLTCALDLKSKDAEAMMLEEHLENYIPLLCGPTINNYITPELQNHLYNPIVPATDNKSPLLNMESEENKFDEPTEEDIEAFNIFPKKKNTKPHSSGTGTNNLFQFPKPEVASSFSKPQVASSFSKPRVASSFSKPQISSSNTQNQFRISLNQKEENKGFWNSEQNSYNKCLNKQFDTELKSNSTRNDQTTQDNKLPEAGSFRTALDEHRIQKIKQNGANSSDLQQKSLFNYGMSNKLLGGKRSVRNDFIPPIKRSFNEMEKSEIKKDVKQCDDDERLKNIDEKMIEMIKNEIMHKIKPMDWNDIAGLEYAKEIIQEAVVWPLLRPDMFTGIRRPPRGILLFGPPGTGKTLIGKCIASQSEATFFSISASSLTSKWVGEGEKMVRALFAVASVHQPSVIFIDEVDSLLCQRSDSEHESSRRMKTEFLIQLDGARTSDHERILVVGATNRPQELDEAARRRFVRRLYIPLPEFKARYEMLQNLLSTVYHTLTDDDVREVTKLTDGYSGADIGILCTEASMEPIRSIPPSQIKFFDSSKLRSITFHDFELALERVRASVSKDDLNQYIEWNKIYGSGNTC